MMKIASSRLPRGLSAVALAACMVFGVLQAFSVGAQSVANEYENGCRRCANCSIVMGGKGFTGSDDGSACIYCCQVP